MRPEAYVRKQLDSQLEDQAHRSLGDRRRNRLDGQVLIVSPIFKWYREDFETGWRGAYSLPVFLALYAADLGLGATETEALRSGRPRVGFDDYNWRLNDLRRPGQ
ncbi:MAG: hypothetical protein N3C12_00385 [Candidatus Binatia bacterium]|nr:hypothetical protein [Candidatus Binatia bacterium]